MRPLKILHIEDNQEDALLFGRACDAAGLLTDFHTVGDGSEAVVYLNGDGKFSDRSAHPLPDLIVLDLKMPGMDGFEFLRWLRAQAAFLHLPALVFTRSTSEKDKARALREGATGYFIKPENIAALVRIAESFRKLLPNRFDKNEQAT